MEKPTALQSRRSGYQCFFLLNGRRSRKIQCAASLQSGEVNQETLSRNSTKAKIGFIGLVLSVFPSPRVWWLLAARGIERSISGENKLRNWSELVIVNERSLSLNNIHP